LVKGAAPRPATVVVTAGGAPGPAARVFFTYDATTGVLGYEATTSGLGTDRVIALTLQRSVDGAPGPIVAHLMTGGQVGTSSVLTMRGRQREDLVAGRLFVHLYTQRAPLGAGRTRVVLP
jgi:hypothetical protein